MPSIEVFRSRTARVVGGKEAAKAAWELAKGFTRAIGEVESWLDRLSQNELVHQEVGASEGIFLPEEIENRRKRLSSVFVWAILEIPAPQLYDVLLKARGITVRSDASARGLLARERAKREKKLEPAIKEFKEWMEAQLSDSRQRLGSDLLYLPPADSEPTQKMESEKSYQWAQIKEYIQIKELAEKYLDAIWSSCIPETGELENELNKKQWMNRERLLFERELDSFWSRWYPEARPLLDWLTNEALFSKDLFDEFRSGWCPARPLFEKLERCSSSTMRQVICGGLARWKSFIAHDKKWEEDRAEIGARLARFSLEHPEYAGVNAEFEKLEQDEEKRPVIRRIVNFLVRKSSAERMPLVTRALTASGEGIQKTRWQLPSDLSVFRSWAPTLVNFLGLHAEYEAIRLALSQRPTKTPPDPIDSRVEPVFAGPDNSAWGYNNLEFPEHGKRRGKVLLRGVVCTGDGAFEEKTTTFEFETGEAFPKHIRHRDSKSQLLEMLDPDGTWRPAKFGGLRLMVTSLTQHEPGEIDPALKVQNAHFELGFLVKSEVEQSFIPARSATQLGEALPEGARILAVTIAGQKLFCAASAQTTEEGYSPATVKFSQHESFGVSVGRVAEANRHFASLQKKTGVLTPGKEFAKAAAGRRGSLLNTLIDTAVAEIVSLARGFNHKQERDPKTGKPKKTVRHQVAPPASVVLLPKVEGIRASLYRETEENSGIRIVRLRWAMERLVQRLNSYGIKVWEVSDFGVYDLCSMCGAIGTRAKIWTDSSGKKCFQIRRNGDHLVCTSCCTRRSDKELPGRITGVAETAARNQLGLMTHPERIERYRKVFDKADKPALREKFRHFEEEARKVLISRGMEEV